MTLKEVSQLTGIPYQTLLGWEKAGGYRRNLARFLRSCNRATLEKHFAKASSNMVVEDGDLVVVEKDGKFSVATYPADGKVISVLQKFKEI
ncbi:hypothetical protein [uncultured Campylobacter sp.]|uniref:hypothetical protein n=1 Tax=uncultured Campylobacter sp. TaxID=218934 RepID=UPI00260C0B73|nr:hypothetical protein [uncultured Campylobacter sp.]